MYIYVYIYIYMCVFICLYICISRRGCHAPTRVNIYDTSRHTSQRDRKRFLARFSSLYHLYCRYPPQSLL